jgi:hypothetical protein
MCAPVRERETVLFAVLLPTWLSQSFGFGRNSTKATRRSALSDTASTLTHSSSLAELGRCLWRLML